MTEEMTREDLEDMMTREIEVCRVVENMCRRRQLYTSEHSKDCDHIRDSVSAARSAIEEHGYESQLARRELDRALLVSEIVGKKYLNMLPTIRPGQRSSQR
ncbi:MAG: hypothetical protein ABII01_04420 [Candidatus Woesearchaeota archaeon]